jgi:hypothetical protein
MKHALEVRGEVPQAVQVGPGSKVRLGNRDPGFKDQHESHEGAIEEIAKDQGKLRKLQELLLPSDPRRFGRPTRDTGEADRATERKDAGSDSSKAFGNLRTPRATRQEVFSACHADSVATRGRGSAESWRDAMPPHASQWLMGASPVDQNGSASLAFLRVISASRKGPRYRFAVRGSDWH